MRSRVRTRTHGSVGRREPRLPLTRSSRLSTERFAPLFQHRMTGTIFVSSVDIGSVNLLKVHFHLMFTLFLLRFDLILAQ